MPSRTSIVRARGADCRRAEITANRSRLMGEIARLRSDRGRPADFLDKARSLLTRHWGKATWSAREGLLKTAGWLVAVERMHGGTALTPIAPER